MDFDLALLLVVVTFVSGVIWLLDVLMWKPKRQAAAEAAKAQGIQDETALQNIYKEPVLVEYARSFFPVFIAVLILRSFLIEPFRIPSGSMMPTLLDGDFILVNKYAYGVRLPVVDTKVIEIGEPQRGDVVVFRYPEEPSQDYIKRVIGVPGDEVMYFNKQLFVNGQPVEQTSLGSYQHDGTGRGMTGADMFKENLVGVEHDILIMKTRPRRDVTTVVPEGQFFVMGDNRDNSNDSRAWGFVPEENLVGRAVMIWMNWDHVQTRVSWDRIGNSIE